MNTPRAPGRRSKSVSARDLNKALATVSAAPTFLDRPRIASAGPQVVVVLGMHRSGTSLLSNVLHYLGVDMADQSDRASPVNPAGFWERPELVELHKDLLNAIGRPLRDPLHAMPFPAGWWRGKAVLPIKKAIRAYLEEQLSQAGGPWGFKDPRTCRLLPMWKEIFEELGIRPNYVWAIRPPSETSASMQTAAAIVADSAQFPSITAAQAEVMWLAYNYDIMRYTADNPPLLVEHGEWFRDPILVARKLAESLGLHGFTTETELAECVHGIVDPDYRHEIDGEGAARSAIPVADNLFKDISQTFEPTGANGRMGGYVAMLDIVFRVTQPFVQPLRDLPALRDRIGEAEDLRERLNSLVAENDDLAATIESKEREIKDLAAELGRRQPEGWTAQVAPGSAGSEIPKLQGREQDPDSLQAELAALRAHSLEAGEARAAAEAKVAALESRPTQAQLDELGAKLAEREKALGESAAETARLKAAAQEAELALAAHVAEAERASAAAAEEARRAVNADEENAAMRSRLEQAQADVQASLAAERERTARLELYAESLLGELDTRRQASESRVTALHARLAEARKRIEEGAAESAALRKEIANFCKRLSEGETARRELQIACDGYLARIAHLKQSASKPA